MTKKTKEVKVIKEKNKNTCGIITCIHCVGNMCELGKCEFYERLFCQED